MYSFCQICKVNFSPDTLIVPLNQKISVCNSKSEVYSQLSLLSGHFREMAI